MSGRSLEYSPSSSPSNPFTNIKRRFGVKLASVGLAARNLFREIVQSPRVVWESLHSPVSRELPPNSNYYSRPPLRSSYQRQNSYQYRTTPNNFWNF